MKILLFLLLGLAAAALLALGLPRPRRALRNRLNRLIQRRTALEGAQALREGLVDAISTGHSTGAMQKDHRDRLLGALDLAHRTVDEIMRHRRQIEMIDADLPPERILSQALASPYTRLPVFRDSDENILGVVHAKDLLREVDRLIRASEDAPALGSLAELDLLKIAMKPYFIPETTTLDEQMREFLKRRTHFALVVDEYGEVMGLVTLEDILEEIVGDIRDEHDLAVQGVRPQPDGSVLVDGAAPVRDLNRVMAWDLPDEEATTIAGLVIHEAGAIPEAGQIFNFHGFRFEVMRRVRNRITALKVTPQETAE